MASYWHIVGALAVAVTLTPTVAAAQVPPAPPSNTMAAPIGPTVNVRATQLVADAARLDRGDGMEADPTQALALYCEAARLGDPAAEYALGWMLANGRGAARDDGGAARMFALAAAQGHAQAQAMLKYVRYGPNTPLPDCMQPKTAAPLQAQTPTPAAPVSAATGHTGVSRRIGILVDLLAPQYNVDPRFAMAIISVESGFNMKAVSPKNAQGLMQLIPETAQRFQVRNALDVEQNVRGGLAYLRWLLTYFKGDVRLVAAAYNAGEKAVEKYGGVPPYPETQLYVRKVALLYQASSHPYQPATAAVR